MASNQLSSPQRRKSAAGAHGGGVEYEEQTLSKDFEVMDAGYVKNRDKPDSMSVPKLNKDAGYNK